MNNDLLLDIKDLQVEFKSREGTVRALDGIDFQVRRGETIGIVGESGCGKSVTARSIMQLIPNPGKMVAGTIVLHRRQGERTETVAIHSLAPDSEEMRRIRGKEISMIFQEPMVSFSPVHTIGNQIIETIQLHTGMDDKQALERAVEMLHVVGIPNPSKRVHVYPFELSGGMRQRAMIAMALSCNPSLLIADEPTTALDVTVQAQILDLLNRLQQEYGMTIMLITHNLGVVASMARRMVVMYLGQVVEEGTSVQIFDDPKHPYTRGLLKSVPNVGHKTGRRLWAVKGSVPSPYTIVSGCRFHPRCPDVMPGLCDQKEPATVLLDNGQKVKCFLYDDQKTS